MEDASLVSCVGQALLALYAAFVLARGAKSAARRALSRSLLFLAAYAGTLAVRYVGGRDEATVFFTERIAVLFAAASLVELSGLAFWCARGGEPGEKTLRPRWFFVAMAMILVALGVRVVTTPKVVGFEWSYLALLAMAFALAVTSAIGFALGARRKTRGSRSYFLACLWLFAPIVLNLVALTEVLPLAAFRLVRDLSLLLFVLGMLTTYLDDGHEPMSLRQRITAGALISILSLSTVCAHLVLPMTGGTGPIPAFHLELGGVRLLVEVAVGCALIIVLAPFVFEKSLLEPLDRLTAGLARVEAGAEAELPVDRFDELGRVARSFNAMVGALDEGRAALGQRIAELTTRQTEIENLNRELRRQIAARSRQLADALKEIDRGTRPVRPGIELEGRYRVGDPLGAGGMGVVFGITRLDDGRRLALKVMLQGSPDDAVRFMREAEIAATLDHPHLVSVIDVGMFRGTPWFVMERLSGGSLAERSHRFGDGPFMRPILLQIARGLEALHARGVLHRDLKPANVLLDGDPAAPLAKIGDFGIARSGLASALSATVNAEAATANAMASGTSTVMGTLPYMAPELALGPSAFGPASDVFAFGVLAWEVLTKTLPFVVPAVLTAQAGEPIEAPACPLEDRSLAALLEACISIDPNARPAAADISRALG